MTGRMPRALATLLGAAALLLAVAAPAWAAQSITLTWVRHAQSTDNASGIISATVPGAGLTALGQTQAQAVAEAIAANAYDGIYTSDMIRTQQTAAPLAADLDITPVVLGGVREIASGILTGLPGTTGLLYVLAGVVYALPPAAWSLGARFVPGIFGEDGNMFNARTTEAIDTVYLSGDTNPVVFSHGGTIQAWTLMNVTNPVLTLPPLGNTDVVVVTGNPEDGWTLQSWAGTPVSQTPDLLTKLFVDFRTWAVAPQTALYNIGQSLQYAQWYPDGSALTALANAVGTGIADVATATVEFVQAVVRDIGGALAPAPPASTAAVAAAAVRRPAAAVVAARPSASVARPAAPARVARPAAAAAPADAASSTGRAGTAKRGAGNAGNTGDHARSQRRAAA